MPQSGPVSVEMTWSETEGMNVDGSCLGSDNKVQVSQETRT